MIVKSWSLAFVAVTALFSLPVAAEDMSCAMEPTVASLEQCVGHAAEMGAIDNAGLANSLLAKLNTAQWFVARGNANGAWTAINVLGAFIGEVQAQAGKHIEAQHAEHMAMHAQMIMDALRATAPKSS